MEGATRRERIRYRFDRVMARGTVALVIGLFIASLLLVLGVAAVVTIAGWLRGANGTNMGFLDVVWASLLRTLDPGTMGADRGSPGFVLAMLVVTLGGIFVVATLIGVIGSGIEGRLRELRKGRSRVLERDHTVVLGWGPTVFTVVAELIEAAPRVRRTIVVLAEQDPAFMEDSIRARVRLPRGTQVICRSGSPMDVDDIRLASVQTSRAIVVLAPETEEADIETIKVLLALANDPERRVAPYRIVAAIGDPSRIEVARLAARGEVEVVHAAELIARITAQACRQPGLSLIYGDLLAFAGAEVYHVPAGPVAGRTWEEVAPLFSRAAAIGILAGDGTLQLNPEPSTPVRASDTIVTVAEQLADAEVIDGGPATVDRAALLPVVAPPERPEQVLILGWNSLAATIVAELDSGLAAGSRIDVAARAGVADSDVAALRARGLATEVAVHHGEPTDRRFLDSLKVARCDHVIVLGYGDDGTQVVDARTLVTLLHLRSIAAIDAGRFSIVSELRDVRNLALAEAARLDDFVVSDRLASQYMAQVAEDPRRAAVFAELFRSGGADLVLRSASAIVRTGVPLRFTTIARGMLDRGETAIGVEIRPADGDGRASIVLAPHRDAVFVLGPDDRIVALTGR